MIINNQTSFTSELDPLISNSNEGSGGDHSSQTIVRTYALAALAAQIDIHL